MRLVYSGNDSHLLQDTNIQTLQTDEGTEVTDFVREIKM